MSQPQRVLGTLAAAGVRVAVVTSRFNDFLTSHMERSAVEAWERMGGDPGQLTLVHVPGAFELPVTALNLAQTGRYVAIVCLGCVIRGETSHYDHVAGEAAKGVAEVGLKTGVPCVFGVITTDTLEQAINRAGAKAGNAGASAMLTAVEMANLIARVKQG